VSVIDNSCRFIAGFGNDLVSLLLRHSEQLLDPAAEARVARPRIARSPLLPVRRIAINLRDVASRASRPMASVAIAKVSMAVSFT
jgi:hypothetical protein